MIGVNYGYPGVSYGGGSSFPASSGAMNAYANYANQQYLYGSPTQGGSMRGVSPPLQYGIQFDQFAFRNPQGAFYGQMLGTQAQARQGMLQQTGGVTPPPGWETMPLDEFLRWAAQARQRAQQNQPTRPNQPNNGKPAQTSPLGVHAHAYQNSQGEMVPVSYVRVNETGNWNSRQRTDNPAGYGQFDTTYSKAQMGKTYTVTVEWADGRTKTVQVINKGWPVDVY